MPSNPEANLISAILRNGDFKNALAHGLGGDMFHTFREEWLWLEDFYRRYRKTPSIETFTTQFGDFRMLRSTDTNYFTDEVRKGHARHLLIALMDAVADDVAGGDIDAAVKKASSSIVAIAGSMGSHTDTDIFSDYGGIFAEVSGRVQRAKERGAAGIPTGFHTIDEATGGWNAGDLSIIGGRLGHGKSWVAQYSAATAAAAGYCVGFYALEQTRAQVAMRIHNLLSAAGETMFRTTALMQGKEFDLRAYRRFLIQLKKSMTGKLHVSDMSRGRVSPLTVAAGIERHAYDIVFVDYITLMQKSGPDWQGVAQLSSDMQALAASYGVPIVCAAQLNRQDGAGKGDPPGPEALAQSDAIGQDAAVIVNIRQRSSSVIQMFLAKNRHGRGGAKWWVQFTPGDGVVKEVSFSKAQTLMDRDAEKQDEDEERTGTSSKRLRT